MRDIGDRDPEDHAVRVPRVVVRHRRHGIIAVARTPIEELEKHLDIKLLPDDEETDVDTIGGLVFSILGRVPARGELIRHASGVEFEVLDADPRRVKKLKIHVPRTAGQKPAAEAAKA